MDDQVRRGNLESWIVELTQGDSAVSKNHTLRVACMLDVLKYVEDCVFDVPPALASRLIEMRNSCTRGGLSETGVEKDV